MGGTKVVSLSLGVVVLWVKMFFRSFPNDPVIDRNVEKEGRFFSFHKTAHSALRHCEVAVRNNKLQEK